MFSSSLTFPALSSAMMSADAEGHDTFVADDKRVQAIAVPDSGDQLKVKSGKSEPKKHCNDVISVSASAGLKPPGLSYIALISMAIQSSPEKKMMLSEIYQWIADRYPYYQLKDKSWRNSIRHNLSLNECFVKCGRSENGKGNYWSIHPANMDDFASGDYRRRRARRRVRMCDDDLQRLCSDDPEQVKPEQPVPISSVSQGGYVPMVSTFVPSNFLSILGVETTRSRDYWLGNSYYHADAQYRPEVQMNQCRADKLFTGCNDPSCREAQQFSCVSSFGKVNDSDTVQNVSPPDSTFSVNVNVNLSGNRGMQTFQAQYEPPCFGYQRTWSDAHL